MQNSEDMAKAFLDQWQQQWSTLATDPAWQQMAQQQWQQFAQNMMNVQMPSANVGAHDPTRAAASPPASDLGAQLLAECFMRLARLEARVADLESRAQ
jgi:hypothetical protein